MESSNQPSFDQQTPTQTPPISNSGGPKILHLILAGIVVTLIAIGAYALGTKQSQPVVQNPVQTTPLPAKASATEGIPSPTSTIDETASWQIYSSNQYKYSFKYPASMNFSTSSYQGIGGTVNTDTWTSQDKSYTISVYSYRNDINSKLEFNVQVQPKKMTQVDNKTVSKIVSVDETLVHVGPINYTDYEYMIIYTSGVKKNDEG